MEPAPLDGLVYGAKLKLQHVQTGRRLHSHASRYPGGSKQQQVTAFDGADDNDWWLVRGPHGAAEPERGAAVTEGAVIRLTHVLTRRNLHSHSIRSPVTGQQEVSCYGDEGRGDGNCNWRVLLDQDASGALRLQHVNTCRGAGTASHFLHSHPQTLPGWGHRQGEVTVFGGRDANDLWRLQEVRGYACGPARTHFQTRQPSPRRHRKLRQRLHRARESEHR